MKKFSSQTLFLPCCVIQEFIAKAITLPGQGEIMDMMEVADPDAVHAVRTFIRKQLASELKEDFINTVCISSYIVSLYCCKITIYSCICFTGEKQQEVRAVSV